MEKGQQEFIQQELAERSRALEKAEAALKKREKTIRQQQEASEENASFLRVAASLTKLGAWSVDVPSLKHRWSEETRALHGVKPGTEMDIESLIQFYVGKDREKISRAFAKCRDEGIPFDMRLRFQDQAGNKLWVRSAGEAVREDGRIVRVQGAIQDITEQVQAEADLRASESRYRSLFENQHTVMLLIDPQDGQIVDANPAAVRFYGWNREAFRTRKIWDINVSSKREIELKLSRAESREEVRFQFQHRSADGEIREVEVYSGPIELEGKSLLFSIVHDVTEQNRADRELGEIIKGAPIPIITIDESEVVGLWNPAAERVLGWTKEEVEGKLLPIVPAEKKSEFLGLVERVMSGESFSGIEVERLKKDGSRFIGRLSTASLRNSQDVVVGILAFLEDVTAAKEAEKQLRLQSLALNATANQIVITDCKGRVEWVNRAFEGQTGYTLEEARGEKPGRLLGSGKQESIFYQELWNTILSGQVWRGELVNRRKDGSFYDEEMTITPIANEAGEISHFVAIKQDISEKKAMADQLFRSQRLESIGNLAGGVAHDLNNILTPILMGAELLEKRPALNSSSKTLSVVKESALRGAEMVQQLLTFARGSGGERINVEISKVVKEVLKMLKETFPKHIEITFKEAPDLCPVRGDPTQIRQVILNLCVNARDAMPEGGQLEIALENRELDRSSPTIESTIKAGRYTVVRVEDNGEGILPENKDRIFEPFFTTKPQGKGTGLGLSTTLGIVRNHQGYLDLESRRGRTVFLVYFPALESDAKQIPDSPEQEIEPVGDGISVLVVDDEISVLAMIRSTLTEWGYRVETASNGAEALVSLGRDPQCFQAALIDLRMPIMGGVEAIRTILRLRPQFPFLVMTGEAPEEDLRALADLGVEHFLKKPFKIAELAASMERIRREIQARSGAES